MPELEGFSSPKRRYQQNEKFAENLGNVLAFVAMFWENAGIGLNIVCRSFLHGLGVESR